MLRVCQFIVDGKPIGKGRPRFTRTGHTYTPKQTKDYEKKIKQSAWVAMQKAKLAVTTRRVSIIVTAYFEIPKSYNKKKRQECLANIIIPKRPDIDNIIKSVLDGCNGIVYEDDCMVWHVAAFKKYCNVGEKPHVNVKVQWDSGANHYVSI